MLRGTADMYVGLSAIHRERNDLAAARQLLLRSEELGEHTALPQNRHRWRVAMARIREAEGDLGDALDLLDEADRVYQGDFSPNVRPVPALRAGPGSGRGGDDALAWARDQGLSADDDLTYLREFEHVTLARALLARTRRQRAGGRLDEATRLLERLRAAAEEGQRSGSLIEILVLQALAHQLRDDVPAALVPLAHALGLAEPEGYVRIFVDEGPPMSRLLRAAAKHGIAALRPPTAVRPGQVDDSAAARPALVEPLSERERDVLGCWPPT